jgi:hypothetical protein
MKAKLLLFLSLFIVITCNSAIAQVGQYALKFDGTDDYIEVPHSNNLNFTEFTLEAWIYKTDNDNVKIIGKTPANSHEKGFIFGTLGNYLQIEVRETDIGSKYLKLWSNELIPLNKWTHVAMTWKSGEYLKGYINGKEVISGASPVFDIATTNSMYIGRAPWSHYIEDHFGGYMDEIRIWNTVKTPEQIRENQYKVFSGSEANLVAYYNMNNSSGASLVDQTSNANNGTINGPAWITSGALDGARKALQFDGVNDYVSIPHNAALNMSAVTMEMWINWTNPTKDAVNFLIGKNYEELEIHTGGAVGNNALRFIPTSGVWLDTPQNTLLPNAWNHVAFVYDPSLNLAKAYINGKEVNLTISSGSINTIITSSTNPLLIGARNGGLSTFQGKIDEVRIWNDVRTQDEIRMNMCRALVGNESNLVAYYKFNEGSGTKAYDYSSVHNNGDLTNMDASTDWINSTAFNTWIGAADNSWTNSANWSDDMPIDENSVGIYTITSGHTVGSNALIYNPNSTGINIKNLYVESASWGASITVNGNLILNSNIDLNYQTLTIGPNGNLLEDKGVFYGNNGQIMTTRNLSNINAENVGGLGVSITSAANLGATTIIRYPDPTGYKLKSVKRRYSILPTNNSNLNATLSFHYLDSELNSNSEKSLKILNKQTGSSTWNYSRKVQDTINNIATVSNLSSIPSDWTFSSSNLNQQIFVNKNAHGANNGYDWNNAFTDLTVAIESAQDDNQVWVAKGTYSPIESFDIANPTPRDKHFRMKNKVAIYGGFNGDESTDFSLSNRDLIANETILSGDIGVIGDNADNCYHIIYNSLTLSPILSVSAILDGFTISDGNANAIFGVNTIGGGILNHGYENVHHNIIVNNCTFKNNYSSQFGGAYFTQSSEATFVNCLFYKNTSNVGGAIYCANYQAINYSTNLTNCTISDNTAITKGGGIHGNTMNIELNNCIVRENIAPNIGKDIAIIGDKTITANYCNIDFSSDITFSNENQALLSQNNNINANPKFVDPANGDFRLYSSSPCIDAGSSNYNSQSNDIRGFGFARKLNKSDLNSGTIDIGAYEYKFGVDPTEQPTIQASNIRFSNISRTGMTVKWSRGDGVGSVLLARESYKIPTTPLKDNNSYKITANANYTTAPTVQGAKVLYSGTSASPSVDVTNLTKYKLMYFKVCEFNNEDAPIYLQTENTSNPASRWTLRRDGLAEEDLTIDAEYAYPNPAKNSISTTMDMFEAGSVIVKLFDETGKESATLFDQSLTFGTHELTFDISSIPSGVYQLVISKGGESIVYPVSIIR